MVVVDKVDKGEKIMKKTYDELEAELMQMVVDQHKENVQWAKEKDYGQTRCYRLHIRGTVIEINNKTQL